MTLEEFFGEHPRLAVAFSGGVDSAYLLDRAVQSGITVRAYYVKSPFQPEFELRDALRLAKELRAEITILPVSVLDDPRVAANPKDRCYYCKQAIFTAIRRAAAADGFSELADGTNASDDAGDRPGMRALRELTVLSPLRLCGLTKEEIREKSREAGLFTWNKPAYACLATRIPAGEPITEEKLARTEWAEAFLSGLGFRDFRVRSPGDTAKLQVTLEDLPSVLAHREEIVNTLKARYSSVILDLEVRRGE